MYNFQKSRKAIIEEGKGYGVTISLIDNGSLHGILQFSSVFKSSESVQKYLERKMGTYNKHSKQNF